MGASLANSGHPLEAIDAYIEALTRRPQYARGWLNLAISYGMLQMYEEAAKAYMRTLELSPSALYVSIMMVVRFLTLLVLVVTCGECCAPPWPA